MQKLTFSIKINASKEKIWQTLWSEETYPKWTNVFCEGSYAVTDWQQGSKVHFLAPNGAGMYSIIEKKIENVFISFKHLGEMEDKKELPLEEKWEGNYENYTLTDTENGVLLTSDIHALEEHSGFFHSTFPQALQNVKDLAEGNV